MIRIGTAGWSVPKQYAAEFSIAGTHLSRYSQNLTCAEINSSFYRLHRISTWEKWSASVPDDFLFSVKAPKTITHEAKLACTSEQLKAFLAEIRSLSKKLGPILFQLPPKSAFNLKVAENFFQMFRDLHSGPTAFEPRHPTWFSPEANHLLERFQIARVAADPALVPEAANPGGWGEVIYYRLHGNPRMYYSAYPDPFLQLLAAALGRQHRTANIWCIFDNTASGAALGDAITLQRLVANRSTR
jgi:uncharacterized protein YecE (DUF72 family)